MTKELLLCLLLIVTGITSCVSQSNITQDRASQSISSPPPPPPPIPPGSVDLKREVDSLALNREALIYKLLDDLNCACINSDKEQIVISLDVNQNGTLDCFDINNSNVVELNSNKELIICLEDILNQEHLFLGKLKFLPNSKFGPKRIKYSFVLKR